MGRRHGSPWTPADFAEKNLRRRECKRAADYDVGRRRRRRLAPGGAFGNVAADLWNTLIAGTSGEPRV